MNFRLLKKKLIRLITKNDEIVYCDHLKLKSKTYIHKLIGLEYAVKTTIITNDSNAYTAFRCMKCHIDHIFSKLK